MTKGFFTKFKSKTKTSNRPARGLCMPGDQGQEGVSSRAGPAWAWECSSRLRAWLQSDVAKPRAWRNY